MIPLNPRVMDATPLSGHRVLLRFSNGEQGIYDFKKFLDRGVFKELRDEHYFRQVKADHGTVVWPNGQDLCPDTLYLESQKTSPSN